MMDFDAAVVPWQVMLGADVLPFMQHVHAHIRTMWVCDPILASTEAFRAHDIVRDMTQSHNWLESIMWHCEIKVNAAYNTSVRISYAISSGGVSRVYLANDICLTNRLNESAQFKCAAAIGERCGEQICMFRISGVQQTFESEIKFQALCKTEATVAVWYVWAIARPSGRCQKMTRA